MGRGWKGDIRRLCRDFCITDKAEEIIEQVTRESKITDSAKIKYQRAWNKFHDIIIAF